MHIIHSQDMPTNFYQSYFDIKLQLEKSQSVAHGQTDIKSEIDIQITNIS